MKDHPSLPSTKWLRLSSSWGKLKELGRLLVLKKWPNDQKITKWPRSRTLWRKLKELGRPRNNLSQNTQALRSYAVHCSDSDIQYATNTTISGTVELLHLLIWKMSIGPKLRIALMEWKGDYVDDSCSSCLRSLSCAPQKPVHAPYAPSYITSGCLLQMLPWQSVDHRAWTKIIGIFWNNDKYHVWKYHH